MALLPDQQVQDSPARDVRLRLGREEVRLTGDGMEVAGAPPRPDTAFEARLRRFAPWAAGFRKSQPPEIESDLHEAGRALASAFLPPQVLDSLNRLVGASEAQGELYLGLEIADPDLEPLPWELLWLPGSAQPLALSPGVRLFRQLATSLAPAPVAAGGGPLGLLVAVAAPIEAPLLDMERELARILAAIEPLRRQNRARVRILEQGSLAAIRRALQEEPCHILHITCHAEPGALALEDEAGRLDRVPAALLSEAIADAVPEFIILAACSTADPQDSSDARFLPAIAQELVQGGIPSVLAMRGKVSDRYATDFVARLLADLATSEQRDPLRSLAIARQSVESDRRSQLGERQPPEWPTPVLFTTGRPPPFTIEATALDLAIEGVPWRLADEEGGRAFVGRRREIRWLLERLLSGGDTGVIIHGVGGVGKSALAHQVLLRLGEAGWPSITLNGAFSVEALARALSGQPASSKLAVLLDGFETQLGQSGSIRDPALASFLTKWLEAQDEHLLLIASRRPVDWPGGLPPAMTELTLGPLGPAETQKLFWRLPSFKELPGPALVQIYEELGGHPGALGRLADRRHATGETSATAELSSRLSEVAVETAREAKIDALLAELSPTSRGLLERVSIYRLPVGREGLVFQLADGIEEQEVALLWPVTRREAPVSLVLAQGAVPLTEMTRSSVDVHLRPSELKVYRPEPNELEATLKELRYIGLLYRPDEPAADQEPERYRVYPWLTALFRPNRTEEFWRDVHHRAAIYWRWQARGPEFIEPVVCLLEARFHYRQAGRTVSAAEVNEWVCIQLHVWSEWEREKELCRETLDWLPDRTAQTAALEHQLGVIAHEQGAYGEALAWYERALVSSEWLGDLAAQAKTLHQLGALAQAKGHVTEAEEWLQQALCLKQEGSEPAAAASTLAQLAALAQHRGKIENAAALLERALDLEAGEQDRLGRAKVQHQLAGLELTRGRNERAEQLYLEAARVFERERDRASFAASLHQLAVLAQGHKDFARALDLLHQAIAIETEIHDLPSLANSRYQLGQLAKEMGSLGEASREVRLAQSLYETLGDAVGIARCLFQQAEIFEKLGQPLEAEPILDQAASLFEKTDAFAEGRASRSRLGRVVLRRLESEGESSDAEVFAELARVLEWARQADDQTLAAAVLHSYGNRLERSRLPEDHAVESGIGKLVHHDSQVAVELAEIRRHQKRFREAIELTRLVAEGQAPPDSRVRAFFTAGEAELALGSERGLADLERGLDLARKIRDRPLTAEGYLRVGNARLLQQDFEDARNAYLMAASIYRQLNRPSQVALCYRLLILLSRQVGREHDAEQFRRAAEEYFGGIGHPDWLQDYPEKRLKAG